MYDHSPLASDEFKYILPHQYQKINPSGASKANAFSISKCYHFIFCLHFIQLLFINIWYNILVNTDHQLSWLELPAHNRSVLGSSPRWSTKLNENRTFFGFRFVFSMNCPRQLVGGFSFLSVLVLWCSLSVTALCRERLLTRVGGVVGFHAIGKQTAPRGWVVGFFALHPHSREARVKSTVE